MKAVFVHDHKFRRVGEGIYSPGGLANDILQRYVSIFGDLSVIGRILDETHVCSTYSKIDLSHIIVNANDRLQAEIASSDAVIIRLPSINGLKAISYAKKLNKQYLVEVVGCVFDAYWNYSIKGKLAAVPAYLLNGMAIHKAPYAVYVTKEFLQRRYPCSGKQIALSDVALQSTNLEVLRRRQDKIAVHSKKLILGTAGAIDVSYKGQEYVIRAIPEIEKNLGVSVEYRLAGGGDKSRLLSVAHDFCVEDRVRFESVIPHDKVFSWLDDLDIYIQPSTVEGLSRALLEAMSRGLPCIATRCGGNAELIEGTCLVKKSPVKMLPQRLADCICRLAKQSTMEDQAMRNFKKANSEYNRELLDDRRFVFYTEFRNSLN